MKVLFANPPGYGGPGLRRPHLHRARRAGPGRRVDHLPLPVRRHARAGTDTAAASCSTRSAPGCSAGRGCASRSRSPSTRSAWPGCALRRADVVHVQWMTIPELDRWLMRARAPMVYTAHDISDRRTGAAARHLAGSLPPLPTGSSPTASRVARPWPSSGLPRRSPRVIPHPIIPTDPPRHRRRPDAALLRADPPVQGHRRRDRGDQAASRGARLLVAGDPMEPVDRYQHLRR